MSFRIFENMKKFIKSFANQDTLVSCFGKKYLNFTRVLFSIFILNFCAGAFFSEFNIYKIINTVILLCIFVNAVYLICKLIKYNRLNFIKK